ncbi:hypothetical protein OESDEN_25263 [Oesophagostomum dentatum]|uniref:carbonic anhydrase n=1 Tax=Oesophagostomum dentatum TaxID=61180 RepID=A0A0B1RU06_OESDE|nr:hypothetical protein OESDEN_25263 [Oesophagostomum dentatum]
MLQVDKKEDVLQSLEDAIMETNNTNRTAELQRYSPSVLIPKDTTTFFRYEGSQTTPPCTEGKIWIILAEPKHVKEEELEFLRQHVTAEGKHEGHTFRETQPLNGRIVFFNR